MSDTRPPLPSGFSQKMEEMLGMDAPAFFASLEQSAALALRLNPVRASAASVAEEFIEGTVPWEPLGRYLKPGARPGAGIAHVAGAFYLQEASAMVSVAALDPRSGERVLDLCAAPGGKSTQIAARLMGEGLLVSNEPDFSRAKILASNLERMGVRNAAVVCAYPDALAKRWAGYFDAVLCDAPCSGEGMFRRDPDARLQWTPASPKGCAKRQLEILDCAAELVRPGGRLVYSTCTFNELENERTVAAFLDRHPEYAPEEFTLQGLGDSRDGMIRAWPHRSRSDGHFAAKLRRTGNSMQIAAPSFGCDKSIQELLHKLEAEIGLLPEAFTRRLERIGDGLYSIATDRPTMSGLRVVSPGLRLLRVGKNYVEPGHALAMTLNPGLFSRCLELDDVRAKHYLAGEVLNCDEDLRGWTLITWNDLPLGWGKASNGQMKNHRPKGLRTRIP